MVDTPEMQLKMVFLAVSVLGVVAGFGFVLYVMLKKPPQAKVLCVLGVSFSVLCAICSYLLARSMRPPMKEAGAIYRISAPAGGWVPNPALHLPIIVAEAIY